MDPSTALLLQGGAAIASAVQGRRAGKQEQSLRNRNAAILADEAQRKREAHGEQAREKRKEGERLRGRQITRFAKSGVRAGTGTPLLVTQESLKRIGDQARIIQERGEFAFSQGTQRSALERKLGRAASKRSLWAAGTSLATGLGSVGLTKKKFGVKFPWEK